MTSRDVTMTCYVRRYQTVGVRACDVIIDTVITQLTTETKQITTYTPREHRSPRTHSAQTKQITTYRLRQNRSPCTHPENIVQTTSQIITLTLCCLLTFLVYSGSQQMHYNPTPPKYRTEMDKDNEYTDLTPILCSCPVSSRVTVR